MNSKKSTLIGIGTAAFTISAIGILIILGLIATFATIFYPLLVILAIVIVLLYFVNKRKQSVEITS
ncbi:MAG: hypothetical protein EHM34_04560 [Nitrosopumilales archaeon]|nr:MAG: hypothetical protein EHM34_04560 [Nitrosopumilales archaeon]